MDTSDGRGDPSTGRPDRDHPTTPRLARHHEVVEQPIRHGFVEDALIAEPLQIQFERFQLDARLIGHVRERDGAEVGLPGFGANAGELGADDLDGVVASGSWVGKSFELSGGRHHGVHLGSNRRSCCR